MPFAGRAIEAESEFISRKRGRSGGREGYPDAEYARGIDQLVKIGPLERVSEISNLPQKINAFLERQFKRMRQWRQARAHACAANTQETI